MRREIYTMGVGEDDGGVYPFDEARERIAQRLKGIRDGDSRGGPVIRIEAGTKDIDPLKWLAAQPDPFKIYFSGRDEDSMETAGIGCADTIYKKDFPNYEEVFAHLRRNLSGALPRLKYYGGIAFAPGHVDSDWDTFGACRFVLPRFELIRQKGTTRLACNLLAQNTQKNDINAILTELEQLSAPGSTPFEAPGPMVSRDDTPNRENWIEQLQHVIDHIGTGEYQKVVLARRVNLCFQRPPDPMALFAHLKNLPSRRYDFFFRFGGPRVFLGSSPERLYRRHHRELYSEAVAGTRRRGKQETDDSRLAEELLKSVKEQREHDFVVDMIENSLHPLCTDLEVNRQKILLKLKEVQHLKCLVSGTLKPGVRDEDLLKALHPTPAVGGCPLDSALAVIRECEPFKRGWYAGVVGSVGNIDSDFAVALRSGTVEEKTLSLYSGVGVVDGSNPAHEWKELDSKITNFMDIIKTSD